MSTLTFNSVSKKFGKTVAVNNVTFSAKSGKITAYLGPNGAGKSSTLRIAAMLSNPTAGEVLFNGRSLTDHPYPSRIAGFCLDPSAMHPGRTVKATLRNAATLAGAPSKAVHTMAEFIGLSHAADRATGKLSLGMRQRLAIGVALMGEPEFLILDEPVNGLDVQGVSWVRSVMQEVASSGGVVLLSSHLLREVQATADHIVMIDKGRIIADGPTSVFTTSTSSTLVDACDRDRLEVALSRSGIVVTPSSGRLLAEASAQRIGEIALQAGIALTHLNDNHADSLEERFRELTQANHDLGAQA